MEAMYKGLSVKLTNNNDETFDISVINSYDESVDEIEIVSKSRNLKLERGFIGDLTYETVEGYFKTGEIADEQVKDTFKDVLLTNVDVYSIDEEGVISWRYKFLKR